jgi:hypothetical protein
MLALQVMGGIKKIDMNFRRQAAMMLTAKFFGGMLRPSNNCR